MMWKLKPVSFIKKFAAALSVVTMCISPLAQGAQAKGNQKKLISQYLKQTGLTTKKQTVGEFWKMVRHVYPPKLRNQIDSWVAKNRLQMMPTFEATTIKAEGREQVRLTMTNRGHSMNLTFTGDEDKPMKVNGVTVTKKELLDHKNFKALTERVAAKDLSMAKSLAANKKQKPIGKNFVITAKEYAKLTPRQKAEYAIRLRYTLNAVQKVYAKYYGIQALNDITSKYELVAQFLMGEPAHAGPKAGENCIVAGYITQYGNNLSCGGTGAGGQDLQRQMTAMRAPCSGGGVSCNPLVYGFGASGQPFCVTGAEIKYATRKCNGLSPLGTNNDLAASQDKKRIIESFLKSKGQNVDIVLNEKGEISEAQKAELSTYFTELQSYIADATNRCSTAPLADTQQSREDQKSACDELKKRAFDLQAFVIETPIQPPPMNCDSQKAGSIDQGDGTCICPEGTRDGDMNGMPACLVVDVGTLPEGKDPVVEEKDDNNWGWMALLGLGVVGLGLWWFLSKDDGNAAEPPVYVPPQPPDPTPSPTTTITPIDPPPPACPDPNVMVNGICTPPVVVPPPDSEGGTTVDTPGRGGGVR